MVKKQHGQLLFVMLAMAFSVLTACQKDAAVANPNAAKGSADTSIVSQSGNFLAASGILRVKLKDSVYSFDASRDSIAFINVSGDNDSRYFGITAINREHTVSFGISSEGFAFSNVNRSVAGSQFLLSGSVQQPGFQLSLRKNISPADFGDFSLQEYRAGNELARGTFYTFLSTDDNGSSTYYRVEGSFDLKLK